MKKIIGLCLVVLLSSVSVFARDGKRSDKRQDPSKRSERMVEQLKLDEKQAAEFRKINTEFAEKMKIERTEMDKSREQQRSKMLSMRDEKNAQLKKVLTDEQYKQYVDNQQSREKRHGKQGKKR